MTPTAASVLNLNGPWKTFACSSGVARPWATKVFHDKLYVGAVCTGESGADLRANLRALVYEYDIATATWNNTPVMNYALDYQKGEARVGSRYDPSDKYWHTWTDTYSDAAFYADASWAPFASRGTPVLTDLEFDATGALIMTFMDRAGMQLGYRNLKPNNAGLIADQLSGEILRACPNGSGGWTLESGGLCGGAGTGANGQGIGGGEFYKGDELPTYHQETIEGGMAQIMGQPNVVVANMDPININSGGVTWLSNSTGAKTQNLEVFSGGNDGTLGAGATAAAGAFGKAVGLGDIEVLCDAAPIQIGNRVWKDIDGDGIQDADEPGIPGVQVTLQTPTTTLVTTTDASGNYLFSGLVANTAYTARVLTTQTAVNNWTTSPANAGDLAHPVNTSNGPLTDTVDSDYTLTGVNAEIAFTTATAGVNNHGLDFGFVPPLIKVVANKTNDPTGIVGAGQRITYTIVLTAPTSFTQTNPVISDSLPAGVTFVPGSVSVTGYQTFAVSEPFATAAYNGGSGWTGNWVETGDDGSANYRNCPDLWSIQLRSYAQSRGNSRMSRFSRRRRGRTKYCTHALILPIPVTATISLGTAMAVSAVYTAKRNTCRLSAGGTSAVGVLSGAALATLCSTGIPAVAMQTAHNSCCRMSAPSGDGKRIPRYRRISSSPASKLRLPLRPHRQQIYWLRRTILFFLQIIR